MHFPMWYVFMCTHLGRFRDKTCNSWDDRESFVKHAGKYDLLSMDYEAKVGMDTS